jgi:hypothetical protein
MSEFLYNPFIDLTFDEHLCFLTGVHTTEKISVFPEWLMDHFKFGSDRIEMMDKTKSYTYADLKLPCSREVKNAFSELDEKIMDAYQRGYEGMAALAEELLFQWTGRMVYGLLYYEMTYESNRLLKQGQQFELSVSLRKRFGYFHLMLQSVLKPIAFVGKKPWTIAVFPLKYSADIFSFRDDAINLLFSFGVNGFGFIACLQDNGIIGDRQKEILEKIKNQVLHPLQFEELYARFHYTDYLMQYVPGYKVEEDGDVISIGIDHEVGTPVFAPWDEDVFAQLLSNYWQVYGIRKEDILQFQRPPLSYLENPYTKDFINPESISLPY